MIKTSFVQSDLATGQIMPNPWNALRYQSVHGTRVDGYEALRDEGRAGEVNRPSVEVDLGGWTR